MTELVITLKDSSYLPNVRRIVKSLVGVEKVSVPRKKRLSRYERSLLDVKGIRSGKRGRFVQTDIGLMKYRIKYTGQFKRDMRLCQKNIVHTYCTETATVSGSVIFNLTSCLYGVNMMTN